MPKATTPEGRMGVYKSLDEVPDRYRLASYASAYADRDVWDEYLEAGVLPDANHERVVEDVRRYGRYWKDHTADAGVHHALATPRVVESYSEWLVADKSPITACRYWYRVDQFYQWLVTHADHLHVYNPVRMAAAEFNHSQTLWEWQYEHHGGRDLD